jgi:hypothetical protein
VGQERAERRIPAVHLLERRTEVGGALLQDRAQQLGIIHDPGLDQVKAELLVPRPVEVVGQQVVPQHELARHAQGGMHDGGHPPGAVLAAGAVVEQRQPPRRADQAQRRAEGLPLPPVRHETPVDLHHEQGRAPVAEFPALALMVAPGDQLVQRSEVAAAYREADELDAVRQPVRAAEQDLPRRPEVDDGPQPEPIEPLHVHGGELAERVAAENPAPPYFEAVRGQVAADVPHVHRAVQGDMAGWGPPRGHRTRLIAHRPRPPPGQDTPHPSHQPGTPPPQPARDSATPTSPGLRNPKSAGTPPPPARGLPHPPPARDIVWRGERADPSGQGPAAAVPAD